MPVVVARPPELLSGEQSERIRNMQWRRQGGGGLEGAHLRIGGGGVLDRNSSRGV